MTENFGVSKKTTALVAEIGNALILNNQTLAIAESCTGGLASAVICSFSGASQFFLGTVVAYANSVKTDVLGVNSESLTSFGAVSKEVAIEMAIGARSKMQSTFGISITGIAGPTGGTPDKPVGTVWISIVGPTFAEATLCNFSGDRDSVRIQSAIKALELLGSFLN